MKLTLHHINLATENVARMDAFYQDVLGLDRETDGLPTLEKKKGYAGDVAFVTDGAIQTHLAQKDPLQDIINNTLKIINPIHNSPINILNTLNHPHPPRPEAPCTYTV